MYGKQTHKRRYPNDLSFSLYSLYIHQTYKYVFSQQKMELHSVLVYENRERERKIYTL